MRYKVDERMVRMTIKLGNKYDAWGRMNYTEKT